MSFGGCSSEPFRAHLSDHGIGTLRQPSFNFFREGMVYVFQEKLFIRLPVVSSLLKFVHSTMIYGSVSDTLSSSTYVHFAVSQSEFRFVIILTDVIGF